MSDEVAVLPASGEAAEFSRAELRALLEEAIMQGETPMWTVAQLACVLGLPEKTAESRMEDAGFSVFPYGVSLREMTEMTNEERAFWYGNNFVHGDGVEAWVLAQPEPTELDAEAVPTV